MYRTISQHQLLHVVSSSASPGSVSNLLPVLPLPGVLLRAASCSMLWIFCGVECTHGAGAPVGTIGGPCCCLDGDRFWDVGGKRGCRSHGCLVCSCQVEDREALHLLWWPTQRCAVFVSELHVWLHTLQLVVVRKCFFLQLPSPPLPSPPLSLSLCLSHSLLFSLSRLPSLSPHSLFVPLSQLLSLLRSYLFSLLLSVFVSPSLSVLFSFDGAV